jgi:PAS domain S-box-containing protein
MSEHVRTFAACTFGSDSQLVKIGQQRGEWSGTFDRLELRQALEVAASLDGLWEWELESGVLHYSDRSAELLGYGKDEIPHATDFFWNSLHPDDVGAARSAMNRCLEDFTPTDVEYRLRTKNGDYRWFRARGLALRDEQGRAKTMAGVLQDITDRKRSEQALQERLRFEKLLSQLSAGFINVPFEKIDEVIDGSLKTLVESLENDRSTVAEFAADKSQAEVTHSYTVAGLEPFPVGITIHDRLPWLVEQLRSGRTMLFQRLPDDMPTEAVQEREYCIAQGIRSSLSIPLIAGSRVLGAMTFTFIRRHCDWRPELITHMQLIGEVIANALLYKRSEETIRAALAENEQLRDRLERENLYLREQVVLKHHHGRIVGQSDVLNKALSDSERVAVTDAPVLLLGETGTGKELLAQTIHELSSRKDRPMVVVNCASLPATLIESELFGREAGAYTGAASAQVGRFVLADGSTLFLDEIGEFPLELQAKLLRVLQDGRFERLGSPETITVDVRIIAATNRDLEKAVKEGQFRADLYHRLNVFPIRVPPLRERREDIPSLVWAFVEMFGRRMGKTITTVPRRTMELLQQYPWPGNIRELSNVVERAMILATEPTLRVELPSFAQDLLSSRKTLREAEREQILRVLQETAWRIRGPNGAANILGLKPTTLEARMARLGIARKKRNSIIS